MSKEIQIPIEYYGIDENMGREIVKIEEEISMKEKKVKEILRVYGEVRKVFDILSEDIRGREVCYIMCNLEITIEFINELVGKELSVYLLNIPVYCSCKYKNDSKERNPKISSLHVKNDNKEKIYVNATLTI